MASAPRELDRPAFYALRSGGWRDLVTLLHPPYTAWLLSYVALGAAAAPHIYADRLAAALAAFFLAVGISAHAFDELHGRPLQTNLSRGTLVALATTSLLLEESHGMMRHPEARATIGDLSKFPPRYKSIVDALTSAVQRQTDLLQGFGSRIANLRDRF